MRRLPIPLVICLACVPAFADEGLWPFNQFPRETVLEKRQFEVSDEFLERLRLASVRIGGGSGAFVSSSGLLLTAWQVAEGCLARLSTRTADYVVQGFDAAGGAEPRCPGLEAAVLTRIEDVTARVKAAAADDLPAAAALERRNAAIAGIEKECARAGVQCSVVKLFSGGRYDLYRYRVYDDVRLVFAPERDLAWFGRERDAITYLRYGLNAAFLRAYEDGRPAATPNFLKWSAAGVREGELVFTAENPAPTLRLATAAQLTFFRDAALLIQVMRLGSRLTLVREFAAGGDEKLKAAQPVMTQFLSGYKTAAGKLIGVRDDRMVARKFVFEGKIKRAVERDPKLGEQAVKVWEEVATAYRKWAPSERAFQLLEAAPAPGSSLFAAARRVVRGAAPEPLGRALTDTELALEVELLNAWFEELGRLNDKDAPVRKILGGKPPRQAAELAVKSSRLQDPAERRRLAASPEDAGKSTDGMIRLAQIVEEPARRMRERRAELIDALETSAAERIAQYRFALFGAAEYPDATGTPRVAYGVVKPYTDRAGVSMPFAASFGGLYYRLNNEGPYQIPQRWVEAKASLDLMTPLDFVSTCDIGGGDAGGPVVNQAGELVGLTFDGNLESLPNIYLYTDEQARAVHVAVQGIAEALRKVYKAEALLKELGNQASARMTMPSQAISASITTLPGS